MPFGIRSARIWPCTGQLLRAHEALKTRYPGSSDAACAVEVERVLISAWSFAPESE